MRYLLASALVLLLAACGASSSPEPEPPPAGLQVTSAWASPTPGGVSVSGGYFTIENHAAEADRLIAATSPRANRVEIHEMSMDGAVMRMRQLDGIDIPPGATVVLAPGGLHLMLMDQPTPLATGEEIPLELTFEHAGALTVTAQVQSGAPTHEGGH